MPIVASDLAVYASTGMPDDDIGVNGGGIDLLRRVNFTQMGAPDVVQVVSSVLGDTGVVSIEGRTAAGDLVTDARPLNGTTPVDMTGLTSSLERILKVNLANSAAGIVTVRRKTGPAIIGVIPPGELGFVAPIRKPLVDQAMDRWYYAKVFVRNRHTSLTLLSPVIQQSLDSDDRMTHVPAAIADDTVATANRLTAPASKDLLPGGSFDDSDKHAANLPAGSAIGVWLCLFVEAGGNPYLTKYILRVSGQST